MFNDFRAYRVGYRVSGSRRELGGAISTLSNADPYQDDWQIKLRFTRPTDRPSVEAALRRASGDREGLSSTWSNDAQVALAFGENPPQRVDLHLRTARDQDGHRPAGMLPVIWFVEPCRCVRAALHIKGWMGRANDMAKGRGMFVYPRLLEKAMSTYAGQVGRWQAVVEQDERHRDHLILRLEP